jgi:hypothetical protein
MRRASSEEDMAAGNVAADIKETQRLLDVFRHGDEFARARAENNLKQIGLGIQSWGEGESQADQVSHFGDSYQIAARPSTPGKDGRQVAPRIVIQEEQEVLREAEKAIQESKETADKAGGETDNRKRLNALYEGQVNSRARNVVDSLDRNFDLPALQPQSGEKDGKQAQFNPQWLAKSQLENTANPYEADVGRKPAGTPADAAPSGKGSRRIVQGKQAALQDQNQFRGPGVQQVQPSPEPQKPGQAAVQFDKGDEMQNRPVNVVERYKQRLEQQTQQQAGLQKEQKGILQAPAQPSAAPQGMGVNISRGAPDYAGSRVYEGVPLVSVPLLGGEPGQDVAKSRGEAKMGDKAAVPFSDQPPVAYPDAEVWKELTARRKEKYSQMDLSSSKPANAGSASAASPMGGGGGMGGMGGGMAGDKVVAQGLERGTAEHAGTTNAASPANPAVTASAVMPVPAGLASIDFEVPRPRNAAIYYFTTTGGDVKVTARAASNRVLVQFARLGAVLAVLLAVLGIAWLVRRGAFRWVAWPMGSTFLILAGVLLMLLCPLGLGLFLLGLAMAATGTTLKIRQRVITPHA